MTNDEKAQEAEVRDDVTLACEYVTSLEDAVLRLTDHYWADVDMEGPAVLCKQCKLHGHCDEPCPAYVTAEDRYEKFAAIRKLRQEIKDGRCTMTLEEGSRLP